MPRVALASRDIKQVAFPSTIEVMGTQDTDHQGLQDEEKTHDNVCQDLQDKENTHFDPIKVNFDLEHPEQEIHEGKQGIELEQVLFADAQADLLHWHYHLNHLPFKCIKNMAWQGLLP